MLLFLVFFALAVATNMVAEEKEGKRGAKETLFLILTYVFGAMAIYFGISYFIYDSFRLPGLYDFHW